MLPNCFQNFPKICSFVEVVIMYPNRFLGRFYRFRENRHAIIRNAVAQIVSLYVTRQVQETQVLVLIFIILSLDSLKITQSTTRNCILQVIKLMSFITLIVLCVQPIFLCFFCCCYTIVSEVDFWFPSLLKLCALNKAINTEWFTN